MTAQQADIYNHGLTLAYLDKDIREAKRELKKLEDALQGKNPEALKTLIIELMERRQRT